MRLLIRNEQCAGDVLAITAAVRDLHRAYPGRYVTAVATPCPELWDNNPRVVPAAAMEDPDEIIDLDCPGVDESNHRALHLITAFVEDLERKLGVRVPAGPCRGDVHLSAEERRRPSPAAEAGHAGPYWILMAGGKYDFTVKWWNPDWYQEVVDHFAGRIRFVQCGQREHWHPPLRNVLNLVGATDVRQFIRLMYHADGVVCPITFAMHLAAAVPPRPGGPQRKPCVVIAGGREAPFWITYPGHQLLHTVGALDCCAAGGCWKSRCQPAGDGSPEDAPDHPQACLRPVTVRDRLRIGKCMTMITPARVIGAIETYYEGGVLKYAAAPPAAAKPSLAVNAGRGSAPVAVTIGVGDYAELAHLAARELARKTGLRTIVLGDREFSGSGLEHPHFLKFRLFDLVDADSLLYFDADMVCLRRWDPRPFFGLRELVTVRDRMLEIIRDESDEWDVPPQDHFNTGLMFLSREHHGDLLRRAEALRLSRPTMLFDQLPLNAARVQLGVPLKFLDRRYNWVGFANGSLSLQMPVFMAHKLYPGQTDLNVEYFNGRYPIYPPTIALNEREAGRLAGRTLSYCPDGRTRCDVCFRHDGTLLPPGDSDGAGYWFMQDDRGKPTLVLADDARVLHRMVQAEDGLWSSTDALDPATCVDESVYREVRVTEDNARDVADRFLAAPAPPREPFRGRGVVMCAGGRHFPSAWVCIRMLRHLGCDLPIELWQLCEAELGAPMRQVLAPYDVRCVDASEVRQRHRVRVLNGWELKPYAILHSDFEEVLYLDADNVPVRDPAFLFDAAPYRRHGAVFWPDFKRLPPEHPIWRICRVPCRDEPEFESGQIVVDKRRCLDCLRLTMHLNEHSDFYYRYLLGDKDTFHMAWRMLGREYAMVPWPIHALPGTMCQHDFDGRRLFQHRNLAKWVLRPGRNRRVEGFEMEDLCLGFLEELAELLGAADAPQPAMAPGL